MDFPQTPARDPEAPTAYHATVAHPVPTLATDDLWVLIPVLGGTETKYGPCRWQPVAGEIPALGDRCVVVKSDGDRAQEWCVVTFDSRDATAAALEARVDTLEAIEARRYIGGTGQPAFTNSWVNLDPGTIPPTGTERAAFFYRDRGRVHLGGFIKSGASAATAFTLPAGYRPRESFVLIPVLASGGIAYVSVSASGAVAPTNTGAVAVTTFCGLYGVSFDID